MEPQNNLANPRNLTCDMLKQFISARIPNLRAMGSRIKAAELFSELREYLAANYAAVDLSDGQIVENKSFRKKIGHLRAMDKLTENIILRRAFMELMIENYLALIKADGDQRVALEETRQLMWELIEISRAYFEEAVQQLDALLKQHNEYMDGVQAEKEKAQELSEEYINEMKAEKDNFAALEREIAELESEDEKDDAEIQSYQEREKNGEKVPEGLEDFLTLIAQVKARKETRRQVLQEKRERRDVLYQKCSTYYRSEDLDFMSAAIHIRAKLRTEVPSVIVQEIGKKLDEQSNFVTSEELSRQEHAAHQGKPEQGRSTKLTQ